MKWFDFLHNNDYTIGITKYKIMNNTKETKRIQFTIEELKTMEFHLGNELETYFEMVIEAKKNGDWDDYNAWRPTYLELRELYDKVITKNGLVGEWRWWYESNENQSK